jgi:flagellar biosynthesis protein FlhG
MSQKKMTQVIGITSGKGGVGKTTIATNIAVGLVNRGHKVMLFDADLGLANAQLAVGCRADFNFSHVLSGEKSLKEIVVTTRQGIRLVPGASGIQQMASLGALESAGIIQAFSEIDEDIDYLIVDTAAGIADSVITFMRAVQRRLIVICDEPSSIADAYGMIKVLALEHDLNEIYLVPNMVETQADGKLLYRRVDDVCQRFLGLTIGYLHSITNDPHILDSLRKYQSVLEFAPGGSAARDFRQLALAIERQDPIAGASGGIQFFVERLASLSNEL